MSMDHPKILNALMQNHVALSRTTHVCVGLLASRGRRPIVTQQILMVNVERMVFKPFSQQQRLPYMYLFIAWALGSRGYVFFT